MPPSTGPSPSGPQGAFLRDDAAPDSVVVIQTSVDDEAIALSLARRLVDERLAACVQIVAGVRSFYRWQGVLRDDREWQLVVKSTAARYHDVEAALRRHHPYEVPEIVAWPIVRGSPAYLDWVRAATADGARGDGGDGGESAVGETRDERSPGAPA